MFDKITYISNEGCNIKLKDSDNLTTNLMNMHLIFEDKEKKILGEVDDIDGETLKARFLGEISGDQLIGGNIRKPSLDSKIRVIDMSEVPLITGINGTGFLNIGYSPLYDQVPIYLNINNFFSNHFAIFGNTGSGKSCGVSRLFQNMFQDQRLNPYKANIFIFDSSGEYYNAFSNLNSINQSYNYRFISTNETEGRGEKLRLPIYLLNKDDLALLLQCTSHSQLPIVERMLKLALAFSQNDVDAQAFKNHIIAKAIMTILYTNETAPNKRNEIFSILASCSTNEFNLEAPVQGVGYVRKFRECFLIDNSGNFSESVLLTSYVSSFIKEEYDSYEPKGGVYYNLDTLEKALNFTLISEGWLRNEQTYGDSVTLKVRLHALIASENAKYFDVKDYVSLETFLSSLLIENGKKYQIVNINLSDVDDEFAKVMTKIYSRLIFDFSKGLKNRGSIPFHIVLEEAHRYIQSDHDRFLFGYNIFERIAKEGRKYGVILGIITQRPVELSDNVISQCTNFLIFKINHPMDIKYIREMVPHITDEIIEKQKSLQPGTCLGFGLGFKIPLIIKLEMPNPSPLSGNCDVFRIWSGDKSPIATASSAPVVPSYAPPVAPPPVAQAAVAASSTPVIPDVPLTSAPVLGNSAVEQKPEYINSEPQVIQNNVINNDSQLISGEVVSNNSSNVQESVQKPSTPLINVIDSPTVEDTNTSNSSSFIDIPQNNTQDEVQNTSPFIVSEESDESEVAPVSKEPVTIGISQNNVTDTSSIGDSLPKYMPEGGIQGSTSNVKNETSSPIVNNDNSTNVVNYSDNNTVVDISGESMNNVDSVSESSSEMVDISGESMQKSGNLEPSKNIDTGDLNNNNNNDDTSNNVIDINKRMMNIINDNSMVQNDEENFKNIDEIPQIQNDVITQDSVMNNQNNNSAISNQEPENISIGGVGSQDYSMNSDIKLPSTSVPEISEVKIDNNGMAPIEGEIILDDDDDDDDGFDDD